MTAGFTEPLTKQVALTGTETDLGALFGESTGKIRLSVPDAATSSVWLGKRGVSTSDDEYKKGTQTQLPTTSLRGWYAITNGALVTVTITMATGGVDAPDWITAGTVGASSGGGGGGGSATEAEQQIQSALLTTIRDNVADVYSEVTGVAKDTSIAATTAAVVTLGGGSTIAQIVSALGTDATTQSSILAKLTTIDATLAGQLDTPLSGLLTQLTTIATNTGNTATNTSAIASRLPTALVGGKLSVDSSGSSVSITGTPMVDTELSASGPLATESTLAAVDAGIPAALGQGTMAQSMSVAIASNQSAIPVTGSVTATLSASSVTVSNTVTNPAGVRISMDGANPVPVQSNSDSTSRVGNTIAVRAEMIGAEYTASNVPSIATHIANLDDSGRLAVDSTQAEPVADGSTLPAAATSHTLATQACTVRSFLVRYTGTGMKYLGVFDQAGGAATAANWTKYWWPISNTDGVKEFVPGVGIKCTLGAVLGVFATEPAAGVAVTPSANVAENFTVGHTEIEYGTIYTQ